MTDHHDTEADNLHELFTSDKDMIIGFLNDAFPGRSFHITNGIYMLDAEKIVPTTVAGFSYLNERVAGNEDVFVIAINSNTSMNAIADQKNWDDAQRAALEDQVVRGYKVALPLTEAFPNRNIVIVTYDEDTPTALYDAMAEAGLNLFSLHKWGYGTDPAAPRIEGAHNFANVYAFPMPNDERPVCHDITVREDQSAFVQVVKLTDRLGYETKQPYILPNGRLPEPNV